MAMKGDGGMKVFVIIHTTTPGGVQRVGTYEVYWFRRLGYDATLLAIFKSKVKEWDLFQKLGVKPIYLSRNEAFGRAVYPLLLNLMSITVDDTIPDAIFAHNIPGGQVYLSIKKRYTKRIPLILYLHDPLVYPISGSFYAICASRIPSITLRLEESLIQEASIVLTNSKKTLVKLLRIHKNKNNVGLQDKIRILYPTLNTPIAENEIKKDRKNYLLTVGRIDHEAFLNLYRIMKNIDLPLIIAGSYHPYNADALRIIRLYNDLRSKGKNIKFIFFPSDDVLLELYKNACLFVYSGHENFNMSAIEAMSAGCPILVANTSGVCEILPKSLREYICLPKDRIDLWVNRILEIVRNDESYRLGKECWRITLRYNINTHMSKLVNVLREVAE